MTLHPLRCVPSILEFSNSCSLTTNHVDFVFGVLTILPRLWSVVLVLEGISSQMYAKLCTTAVVYNPARTVRVRAVETTHISRAHPAAVDSNLWVQQRGEHQGHLNGVGTDAGRSAAFPGPRRKSFVVSTGESYYSSESHLGKHVRAADDKRHERQTSHQERACSSTRGHKARSQATGGWCGWGPCPKREGLVEGDSPVKCNR